MANKFDLRQSEYRGTLDQIGNPTQAPRYEGDNLLNALNNQLTPLLRMSAASVASLVVSVGGGDLTDAETSRRRAIPHVGTAYIQFTSGTITFPASSGGNITCSPGTTLALTVASGNYAAVLVYLDGTGNLNVLPGADSAVLNTAITNLPPSPDDTLPLGFIVVHNVAGVIQNITQDQVAQFGTGTGGGGSGNVTAVETALRDYNNFAGVKYLDPNIFRQSKATKVSTSGAGLTSTGAFDLVKNAFKFTSIGQTFISTNLANAEFLSEGVDITDSHLYVHWLLSFVDASATYEMSRDGGTNWTTFTMTRVGTASNAWRGYSVFAAESVQQSLDTVAATGAGSALNATTQQQLSSKFIATSTGVITSIDTSLNYGGAGTGLVTARIVKDSAGAPSTSVSDILAESNAKTISTASLGGTGNITVNFDIPDLVLVAGTYHIVLLTDSAYKAGTLDLSWRSAAGTDGANFNGTSWTTGQASKAHTTKGRYHDLRVRITAGTALTYLEGMGVYFPSDDGLTRPNGTKYVQRFYFSGDANQTDFVLNWVPDPDLLDILDPYRGQSYAIEQGVAKIAGQTVTFAPNTFNFPGESIVLIFRQVKGIAIDNSDSNAAAISTINTNLDDIGNQISDLEFVKVPMISVPNTTIVNRAKVPDMSQDLDARMAVGRISIQNIYQLRDEVGSSGEQVYAASNDRYGRLRFVGVWQNNADATGVGILAPNFQPDYAEIVFYGTGLNLLTQFAAGTNRDLRATVDGGAEGANFWPANQSSIINNRFTSTNQVLPVVSGLTLGMHTVKITNRQAATNFPLYGFEILNQSSNITVNPGSQFVQGSSRTLATQQSFAFNTTFETGTLGTRGGRVMIYHKSDGTIAKAVTPTDASQLNLNSASHANEEIVRKYAFREFGANRADDFSTLTTTTSNRAFTLDDGTVTLIGNQVDVQSGSPEGMRLPTNGTTYVDFTFVGTGLDLLMLGGTNGDYSASVDGTSVGNLVFPTSGGTIAQTVKIVSGLPYGSHTVKVSRIAAAGGSANFNAALVYQPKTPTVPNGAKAISAYNIMATFAANSTAGQDTIATGTLRKTATREFNYSGTWSATIAVTDIGGWDLASSTTGDYVQYTFFGTGFEYRFTNSATASTWQFTVDNSTNLTTLSGTPVTSSYGAGVSSFTASTGTLVTTTTVTTGNGIRLSGLTLGLHTVRFTKTASTGALNTTAFDIIVPIHSYKSNLYSDNQNTLSIGSQSMEDQRKISSLEQVTYQKAWSQAFGITSAPTMTGITALQPMPDMSTTIKVANAGSIDVFYSLTFAVGATAPITSFQVYVDGTPVGTLREYQSPAAATTRTIVSDIVRVPVDAGVHKVDVYWAVSTANTVTATGTDRTLLVREA